MGGQVNLTDRTRLKADQNTWVLQAPPEQRFWAARNPDVIVMDFLYADPYAAGSVDGARALWEDAE
jgi:hypothetical protein